MGTYRDIIITRSGKGYGGPLTIRPTGQKHVVMYVTGGQKPAIVDRIVELSGMTPVDGFKTSVPDDEVALAIIDCGGVLRCGIYPQKNIKTVNIMSTGKAGPFAKYMNETNYVSGITKEEQIKLLEE